MNQHLLKVREQVYTIIFEADTRAGRAFNLGLSYAESLKNRYPPGAA